MSKETWNKLVRSAVDQSRVELFEAIFLPHLDAAYNLAHWLTRNQDDARDVVQEAYLRALRSFDTFQQGRAALPWLLKIVRNTCYTWLRRNRPQETVALSPDLTDEVVTDNADPEASAMKAADSRSLLQALERITLEYREVLVLREMEGLTYKEIAELLDIPVGTVMSRLSRGRRDLNHLLRTRELRTKQ